MMRASIVSERVWGVFHDSGFIGDDSGSSVCWLGSVSVVRVADSDSAFVASAAVLLEGE